MVILILIALLLYFNSLKGGFQFDDHNLIDRKWTADLNAFNQNVKIQNFENRPILLWTFALNNTLHQGQVFGFHLTNLLLHTLVTILLFTLLIRTQNIRPGDATLALPFLAALLFAVHPLNTDSVSYIASRSTLLATFFYLLSLYLFLQIFSLSGGKWKKPARMALVLLTAGGLFLALASKLIAVTLPVLLGVWFCCFIAPVRFPRLKAAMFGRKSIPVYAGLSVLLAAVAAMFGPRLLYSPKDQGLELFGRLPYFWVQTKVIVFYYLNLFFAPVNLNVDNGFPFTALGADPLIPLSLLVIVALLLLALRTTNLWIRAGVLGFFITLLPTSSFVPLNDLAVEHRMYLPMALGLCVAAGALMLRIPAPWRPKFAVALAILLGALTIARNQVWTDELHLWQDAAGKNPRSPRTQNNLGKAYYEKGNLDLALVHLKRSTQNIPGYIVRQYNLKDPKALLERRAGQDAGALNTVSGEPLTVYGDLAEPHYNLASVYLDQGQLHLAEQEYRTAIRLNPDYFSAILSLGSVHARKGQYEEAIASFQAAIDRHRAVTDGGQDYPLARLNLGEVYGRMGRFSEAIEELNLAVQHDPSLVLGHYNLGVAHLMTGNLQQAERALKTCLTLDNRFEPAHFNLARVYQAGGDWQQSSLQFERFLSLKGPDAGALYQIGWNREQAGQPGEARGYYEKALALQPDFLDARIRLGKLYLKSRQKDLARRHLEHALRSRPPPERVEEISRLLQELS